MSTPNVNQLFKQAQGAGELSARSLSVLNVPNIGQQITAALGVPADQFPSSEAILITLQPDDSGSITSAGNVDPMIEGHNSCLDALAGSKQKSSILVSTQYLNGQILNPYTSLENAVRMSRQNYQANKGTPLYDRGVVLLGSVLAKSQEFADQGILVRSVTCIMTDGQDYGSVQSAAADVASLVKDLERTERHVVAAMGFDNGDTDFRRIFREMGIRDQWILTPGNTPSEIRRAFQVFSQSAVQISQGAAVGGFTG